MARFIRLSAEDDSVLPCRPTGARPPRSQLSPKAAPDEPWRLRRRNPLHR